MLLAVAQVTRPIQLFSLESKCGVSLPHTNVARHIVMEAPSGATDIQPPNEIRLAIVSNDSVSRPGKAPTVEYAFTPLGPFWTGRILRRIVSAEPDGH
jgi:hypothetical protein